MDEGRRPGNLRLGGAILGLDLLGSGRGVFWGGCGAFFGGRLVGGRWSKNLGSMRAERGSRGKRPCTVKLSLLYMLYYYILFFSLQREKGVGLIVDPRS